MNDHANSIHEVIADDLNVSPEFKRALLMAVERDRLDEIETLVRRYLDNNGGLVNLLNEIGDAVEMTKHKRFAHKIYRLAVDAMNYEDEE